MSGPDAALHHRFRRGLALAPGRPAIRAGDRDVSYEAVHEMALRWAGTACDAPGGPPAVIGVLAAKSAAAYVAVLAALYAGATVVPLNPGFPAERTRQMLDAAGVGLVFADRAGRAALSALGQERQRHFVLDIGDGQGAGPAAGLALPAPRPAAAGDTAYVLFTSGSTGRPKGVRISHGSLAHYFSLLDENYGFAAADVFSQTFDLNFDCAMFDMFGAWGAGASIDPVPAAAYRDIPAYVTGRGITVWFSVPSTIALQRRLGVLRPGSLPSLRWSLFAGEALRAADAAGWQAAAPASTVGNLYGPTELTITVTGHRWDPATSPGLCVNGLAPIGFLHPGHDHFLLSDDGEPAEAEGELCVTGPQLTPGYLDPADGEGRFVERARRRWYRTGDRVRRLADGQLVYLGRRDSQVQIQGWRVELAEVEHAMRGCADVSDAVAVTRPAAAGLELVVFYTGSPRRPADLARNLRAALPAGLIPRAFIHRDVFPLNGNRKIDRGALAREAQVAARP
ncbi:MAG TPA: AMP-binding protein [Streptosporangiaceae bacterium]|nr:AMP-binding protein [Streptosporangiaceae bacterium]